jgi:hypothetical protein
MADQPSEISSFSLQAAKAFSEKYANTTNEKQYSQSFWTDLFTKVIGVPDLLAAGIEFEYPVISAEGKTNWIDVFWSGVLLIEQKSTGKNLDLAETQARSYLVGLPPEHRPPAIILSDFSKFRIIDVLMNEQIEFSLSELSENLHRLELILGKQIASATRQEVSADIHAVELMGNLFNSFDKSGYEGHALSVFLVRVLFLNFGDDTRMWKRKGNGLFSDFVSNSSNDGNGLGAQIQELFQILNTPIEQRTKTISSNLADFPYINGGVFEENLPIFSFNAEMRKALVETTQYDWSKISPAIFGAMFQTVKSKEDRRSLGEHYTSEANILKVIRPLFLDEYLENLTKSWESISALKKLRKMLSENQYLDPACGSGNFLVVAFKRLRELDLKIVARLNELEGKEGQNQLEGTWGLAVHLNQFHGIEINEWSSQIATVAMFIADHQANLAMEEVLGTSPEKFPLKESAKIVHANALTTDWSEVMQLNEKTFIFGNPPFIGAKERNSEQSELHDQVWSDYKGAGSLDFVTCWFLIASHWTKISKCKFAFVSTNSIAQGRQPDILWQGLNDNEVKIDFAYQSFRWKNGEAGEAVVTCVIIGFSHISSTSKPLLWVRGSEFQEPISVKQINPYLVDGQMVTTPSRRIKVSKSLSPANYGSIAYDNGSLILDQVEYLEATEFDPAIKPLLRRFIGGREMLYKEDRYCIWLQGVEPNLFRNSKFIQTRLAEVKAFRSESKRSATNKLAQTPGLFGESRQPEKTYVAVAKVSSEKRKYIPSDIFEPDVISSGSLITICSDRPFLDFAIVSSRAFAVWNEAVSGRMKTDFQVSVEITYNNFPFPDISEDQKSHLEALGEEIIKVRNSFTNSNLADLYDPLSTPPRLIKAHDLLDESIAKIYGLPKNSDDGKLLSALFEKYSELISSGVIF